MQRSIIPKGFESTAHPVFRAFVPPISLPEICPELKSVSPVIDAIDAKIDETNYPIICAICLEHIADHATLVQCRHQFCMKCILTWFKIRISCPVCKQRGGYFLQGNVIQSDMKMWCADIDSQKDTNKMLEMRPCKENVQIAITSHKAVCRRMCRVETVMSNIRSSDMDRPSNKKARHE